MMRRVIRYVSGGARCFVFFAAIFSPVFLFARDPQIITIQIENNQKALNISSSHGMTAADMKTGRRVSFPKGSSYRVIPAPGGLSIRGEGFSSMVRLITKGESIRVTGRYYRDGIISGNEELRLFA